MSDRSFDDGVDVGDVYDGWFLSAAEGLRLRTSDNGVDVSDRSNPNCSYLSK
ncbi:hypothetical protein H6G96_05920 [Nostoc sp. FACHB-892]|uniref:hypothetical protein n=1 Tax=Nostoc sp. FACHB-892 TaxID=2692843 RepID=UPI00168491D4|nr:hypothetical protein [Nostoc sp. FACHB-892]MBD2725870.1 hypothetical protein [Nostoc sp. FACHB-892]